MTKPLDLSAAAASLGRKGGQSTSEAKQAAARANGKRGGRPKKEKEMEPDNYEDLGDQDEINEEDHGNDNPLAILTEQPSDPINDTEVD